MAIEITSNDIIPVDTNFRLKAGPGAGKTYWLINHVRNVLENANLGKVGKIVCLTYSNIGVDTILSRLYKSRFIEVSTIHSFLYSNLIKPYLYLIADKYGFSINQYNGLVDDYICDDYPSIETIQTELRIRHPNAYINQSYWSSYLKGLKWRLKENDMGKLSCYSSKPINVYKGNKYPAPTCTGIIYKKMAWSHGIMHYDDVNFFAYKLIFDFPWLAKLLSIAYPYIFIDEFQDTDPIQAFIFEQISKYSAHIGIIGDVAQSIYGFQGASPKCFIDFKIPQVKELIIKDNHRSTPQIVKFLNCLRRDIKQESINKENGSKVKFLVGNKEKAFSYVTQIVSGDVLVLSYSNEETNSLRYQVVEKRGEELAIKIDDIVDTNRDRKLVVSAFIKAIEHAKQSKFKYAYNVLERVGINPDDATQYLKILLHHSNIDKLSLTNFIEILIRLGINISSLRSGNAKKFYDNHTYGQLAQSVGIEDNNSNQRTIHKAKGDESESVLVLIGKRFKMTDFINFDVTKKEEHRVYYVAMSRAKNNLFVNIPFLTPNEEILLKNNLPIDVVYL